jgi:hypothetical protein
MNVAVAILCKNPSRGTLDFASLIGIKTKFNVYVVVDDIIDTIDAKKLYRPKVTFINYKDIVCVDNGYINSNIGADVTHIKKNPIAYDKALLHFCKLDTSYDFVWFLEDDVFLTDANVLNTLTDKYSKYDLVVGNNNLKEDNVMDWHWRHIVDKIEPPYYFSMVSACAMSRKMLDTINDYVTKNNTLFYIEAMFNTLAMQNKLSVAEVFELKSIVWMGNWGVDEFVLLPTNLFHPVKEPDNHHLLRDLVRNMIGRGYKPQNNLPDFIKELM